MRDEKADTAARLPAAKAAVPYVHPKLAAIDNTHHGPDGGPVRAIYYISDHPMTPDGLRDTDDAVPKQLTPWRPGQSGNPAGRPKGSRHKALMAIDLMLDGESEAITRKAIELAKAGDLTAIRICLDRTAPARRDRTVAFALPRMETVADAFKALGAVAEAAAPDPR